MSLQIIHCQQYNIFVVEPVAEVVAALRRQGVYVGYTPQPEPEAAFGFIFNELSSSKLIGMISGCAWLHQRYPVEATMARIPIQARTCLELTPTADEFDPLRASVRSLFHIIREDGQRADERRNR